MTESNSRNSLAAEAGQPPSRDPEFMAAHNKMWRDLLFQPPCECDICLRQYRTKDQQQSYIHWRYLGRNRDPASLSQSFVKSIKEDRLFLYQTILASGPALLKRWRIGEARRKEYLTKTQPDIYPYSQPLIEIPYRGKTLAEAWKLRVAYLLPYVNVEDLGKDSANSIPLLHYRTTFPPEDWVSFDNAQLQPSWKQGCYCEKSAEGMDKGSALQSLARFRLPTGKRDEQWLSQRDQAQQNLSDLWEKARHAYQMTMEASKCPNF